MRFQKYFLISILFFPSDVFAFSLSESNFSGVVKEVIGLLNIINPILITLSFILFFWGLSKFVLNANNEAELKKGKNYMMWSILALFILVSYSAIISLIVTDLDVAKKGENGKLPIPTLRTDSVESKFIISPEE